MGKPSNPIVDALDAQIAVMTAARDCIESAPGGGRSAIAEHRDRAWKARMALATSFGALERQTLWRVLGALDRIIDQADAVLGGSRP
jgi:hypothetical protein